VEEVLDYGIILLDPDGCIRSWNLGAKRNNGYERDEVIGRHFSMLYPEELLARRVPQVELETARDVGRSEDESWRLRKDGSRFWGNRVITRLLDDHGELRGYVMITRDITERHRDEGSLGQSEERFRLLVEGVRDYAIFMLDPDGIVISWNAGAEKNKGYTAAEILGKHFSTFYPDEQVKNGWPQEELRRALAAGQFEDEGWRIRKDGSRFWANVLITALYDERGRHRGFAKVTRDMTDKRLISTLEDEGRRINQFLAMLGHELRGPLAPISNALSIMEMTAIESPELRAAREVIARQLKHMTRLVDDLLDVGRITSGKIHLESKPVNLREAVTDAVEAVEPLARGKSHSLRLALEDGEPWVIGDKARLVQVIGNLLTNAVKFTPSGGQIVVSLNRDPSHANLSIKDSGIGIPNESLNDIFEPFVQGDQDVARSTGGLGLGLSLVRQIVALHGGEVAAYSARELNRGSDFIVRLPLIATPSELPPAAAAVERGPGRKILIIEDNRDAASTLRTVVRALGHHADVVFDGEAAFEAIRSRCPDAVLLDIGLPGQTGLQIAERVRAEIANPPPLIAITGYGQDSDRAAATQAGISAYLTKPVDIVELSRLLRQLLL
jgi:PAS domain S-box-containing protein